MANDNTNRNAATLDWSQARPVGAEEDQKPEKASTGATDWSQAKPVDGEPSTPQPSTLAKIQTGAEKFVGTIPGIGLVHRGAGAVQDWASRNEPLHGASSGPVLPLVGDIKQFGTGALADTAGMVRGATSPVGLATTGAAIVAPEVASPAFVAHGAKTIYDNAGDVDWRGLLTHFQADPDKLQKVLTGGAEIAGGAAGTGAGIKSRVANFRNVQAAQAPQTAASDFTRAVPPSKTAMYQPEDVEVARPYLEAEHRATPIKSVEGVRDAADSAVRKIEDQVSRYIQANPRDVITTRPLEDVRQALGSNKRAGFADAGLKDLEPFGLDQPKTVAEADAIRRQLNAENSAVLKRNNYDQAKARVDDPAFAAREAAAESLRDGIYSKLQEHGVQGVGKLRADEGALLRLRNAAQNHVLTGEKSVPETGNTSTPRKIGAELIKAGSTGVGAAIGGWPGAIIGRGIGEPLGNLLTPGILTRDALIERSFGRSVAPALRYPEIPPRPPIAGRLPAVGETGQGGPNPATGYPAPGVPRTLPRIITADESSARPEEVGTALARRPADLGKQAPGGPRTLPRVITLGGEEPTTALAKIPGSTPTTHLPSKLPRVSRSLGAASAEEEARMPRIEIPPRRRSEMSEQEQSLQEAERLRRKNNAGK